MPILSCYAIVMQAIPTSGAVTFSIVQKQERKETKERSRPASVTFNTPFCRKDRPFENELDNLYDLQHLDIHKSCERESVHQSTIADNANRYVKGVCACLLATCLHHRTGSPTSDADKAKLSLTSTGLHLILGHCSGPSLIEFSILPPSCNSARHFAATI